VELQKIKIDGDKEQVYEDLQIEVDKISKSYSVIYTVT
jgi:hypothetical protein